MFNVLIVSLWLDATLGLTLLGVTFERPEPVPENTPAHTIVTNITVVVPQHHSLVGGPAIVNPNPIMHPFVISPADTNRWQLMTSASPKLDFETVSLYTLPILVRDSKGSSASQTIFIQIADVNEPPIFTGALAQPGQAVEIYMAEDILQNTGIFTVTAKDPEEAPLKFSIAVTPNHTVFEIDDTGILSTIESFNFESNEKSYSVKVTVTDPEGLSVSRHLKVFLVQVRDTDFILTCTLFSITKGGLTSRTENSTSLAIVNITLDEELSIGKTVGTCHVRKDDPVNDITFSLNPSNPYFMIDRTHGTLAIASRLDMEEDGFFSAQSFTIKACKNWRCSGIAVVANIHSINDNQPFCDQYVYRYTGKEVIAKNTVVANVSCHDRDKPPDVLHYEPNSGPVGAGMLFEQVAGAKNAIWITQDLDYEDPRNLAVGGIYEMSLSVSDDANPSHTVTATIIVEITPLNEFNPEFENKHYVFTVPETAGAKHQVGKVMATDKDHPSNCVTYRIVKEDVRPVRMFWLNPESGMLELMTQPDYESVQQYNLTIEAVDCDMVSPRTAYTLVTINIKEENDEAPECKPSTYRTTIHDSLVPGTNINSFILSCHDRDSAPSAMRFEIVSGNVNTHFSFDPSRGSSSPKLIMKTPFDFEGGVDFQQQYHLVVHIIDDNVYNAKVSKPRTGTVLIDISVVRTNTPSPATTSFEQKKGLSIVYKSVNTFSPDDWYVPFIFTLMAILSVGLVACCCFLIWRYASWEETCFRKQAKTSKAINKIKTYKPGTQKETVEVTTETTIYETVFDGEAKDPVTGDLYQYNSKSGARKWKVYQEPSKKNMELTNIYSVSQKLSPKDMPMISPKNHSFSSH